MANVAIRNIDKKYEGFHAVKGITLDIPDQSFVVLVGPSGCGKSTTLRMIAGLEAITEGDLYIGSSRVNDLPPGDRDVAMVFQNYALYPHMTVYDNIAFGLRQRKFSRSEIDRRVMDVARMLSIDTVLNRKPRALSGGQRQRVAMGRAMVRNPSLFLFDEPLSNLDAKLRVHMRTEIKRLHQTVPTTTIYVTHDQVEAMTLADIVVVMNQGKIEQYGPPQELYHKPATRFVAGFIGSPAMNFFPVSVALNHQDIELSTPDATGVFKATSETGLVLNSYDGKQIVLGLRPEHFSLAPHYAGQAPFIVTIDVLEPLGQEILMYCKSAGEDCCIKLPPEFTGTSGDRLKLYPDMSKAHYFDATNGIALR